jgi:hypothetical protein
VQLLQDVLEEALASDLGEKVFIKCLACMLPQERKETIESLIIIPKKELAQRMVDYRFGAKVISKLIAKHKARMKRRAKERAARDKVESAADEALTEASASIFGGSGVEGGGKGGGKGRKRKQFVVLEYMKQEEGDGSVRDTLDRAYTKTAAYTALIEEERLRKVRVSAALKSKAVPAGDAAGAGKPGAPASGSIGGAEAGAHAGGGSGGRYPIAVVEPQWAAAARGPSGRQRSRPLLTMTSTHANEGGASWKQGAQVVGTLALTKRHTRQRGALGETRTSHKNGVCRFPSCDAAALVGNYGYCSGHRHDRAAEGTAKDGGAAEVQIQRRLLLELAQAKELREGRKFALGFGERGNGPVR